MNIYLHLFECSPDTVIVVNHRGIITNVNAQGQKSFGYTRDEIIGQTVELLIPHRLAAAHAEHRTRYGVSPELRPMGAGLELLAKHKDGREIPVEVMLSPVETEEGKFVLAVVRDITERKNAEEAQISLITQLQNSLKEIRTLRGILPICAWCNKIQTDTGSWQQMEAYVRDHTEAEFSHGMCPSCFAKESTGLKR